MKKILVIVVVILSFAVIIVGKMHWNNKIEASARTAQAEKPDVQIKNATEEYQEDKKKVANVEKYSKNLPKDIQTKLIAAVQNGKPVNLVIAGSSSTPEDPSGWPTLLKKELENTYGEDLLNITIKEISDKTSTQVLQEELYQEIISLSPDILLLEPFILYDNSKIISIDVRLENIHQILEAIKAEFADLSVILQPANPLHNAKHYPKEVERLEAFAAENNFTYLNHWEAWPDYQSDKIVEYLNEGLPSQRGHKLWMEYLGNYFIAKE
ncbi:SGNH/GDSL hydrolase family protein [Bacillus sp. 1P02SD]|uniref:SGNH/GDSL hydrolase family protein n=1 Tax=Bacillus sp. 1P02SD TaxID=3132264 RepID=UPI0039A26782